MIKSAAEKIRKVFEQPVNRAIDRVAGLFSNEDQLNSDDKQLLALLKAVLPTDSVKIEKSYTRIRLRFERQNLSERKIDYLMDFLRQVAPMSAAEALQVLQGYDALRQRDVLSKLLALSVSNDQYREDALDFVRRLAADLKVSDEEFAQLSESVRLSCCSRGKIIRSGTGIILALIVIGLFILIATWLSSLLFGLAMAYIFLPLEQYFERRLRREPGKLTGAISRLMPRKKIINRMKGDEEYALSEAEIKRRYEQSITTKATTLTVSCVVVGCLILLVGGLFLLNGYVSSLDKRPEKTAVVQVVQSGVPPEVNSVSETQAANNNKLTDESDPEINKAEDGVWAQTKNKVRNWEWVKKMFPQKAPKPAEPPGVVDNVSNHLLAMLDKLKLRFQQLPLVQSILNELSNYLSEGKAEKHLTELLLKKSGGLFTFLGKFVAMFANFLLNILLTFFFFSLLLSKIAGFVNAGRRSDGNGGKATGYLIRTVFNGKWLPQMAEENLQEGDRIVGEVINKLRIWLRGYLMMIFIDFCVYTTVFVLLDVPYAPILGAIAGVGILLPYIGPVASALLTVLVTLAVGGADVTVVQIACIIGAYLIHNGVIEQFFIYPMVIGESLGLTTLETIIVVLLGGILAGIPGMIFALPTASVIKYLVPQIYRCWH